MLGAHSQLKTQHFRATTLSEKQIQFRKQKQEKKQKKN